ncbi:hypothetical protein LTR85_010086 [Meristemomyces frigidus]|nr:hypothetical protein LTR85_010086 [Meristemomyces frigidus]
MATAVNMIEIEGLSDEQRQVLGAVKVGDTVRFEKQYAPAVNDDAESESEDDGDDVADDGEEEGEQDEDADEDDEEEDEAQGSVHDDENSERECLYLVTNLVSGENGAVVDINLVKLHYSATYDVEHSYKVFGTEVDYYTATDCTHLDTSGCEALTSFQQLDRDGGLQNFTLRLNPDGDFIRTTVLQNGLCPANCKHGWLASLDKLAEYVHPDVYATDAIDAHRPVCPVCIGLDLLKEQQTLRLQLEAFQVDLGDAIDWTGRLNTRRRQVGHRFHQFDEREWGLEFDDMIPEGSVNVGNGDAAADGGQFQQREDALDPNAEVHARYRPASDTTIAALPRIAYKDMPMNEEEEKAESCVVCQIEYAAETIVAVLPCKHFSCDGECTEMWLKQYDTCQTCRQKITPEESKAAKTDDVMAGLAGDATDVAGVGGPEQNGVPGAEVAGAEGSQQAQDAMMSDD